MGNPDLAKKPSEPAPVPGPLHAPQPAARPEGAGAGVAGALSGLAGVAGRVLGGPLNPLGAVPLFGGMFGADSHRGEDKPAGAMTLPRLGLPGLPGLGLPVRGGGPFDWLTEGRGAGPGAPASAPAAGPGAPRKTDEQLVSEAVQKSQEKLTRQGFFDSVTKEEAVQAMQTLRSLPAELQGKAIEKMSPETFRQMLSTVPAGQREQFKSLVDSTQDPDRKLLLFGEYHKSKAGNDAAKEAGKTGDEGSWFHRTDEQKENRRKNEARDEIVANTREEVDAEIEFLRERAKSGKLSAAEIQKYMDNKETEQKGEMKSLKNNIGTLEGLSEADRIKYTQNQVEKKLDSSGIFNTVTDGEATGALKTIKSLPPDLQGKLIEKMDKDAFENLLKEVPKDDRTQFDTLLQNTHDPERKLKLWGEYHKAKTESDAAAEERKTQDEGSWYWRTKEQKENKRLNDRRDEIVDSTRGEVDDEVAFLLEKQKKGALTEADVDALMQRKEHEHDIEMKHNVNLVNDTGTRKDGTKIVWDNKELTDLESGLGRMPEDHVKHNSMLKEIRRSGVAMRDGVEKPNIGGDHGDGKIRVYDTGVNPNAVYRHTGDNKELADPNIAPGVGPQINQIEEVIIHEVGHDIHDQHPDAFKKFQAAAGWQEGMDDAALKSKGLSDADILKIKGGGEVVGKDGQHYEQDPYVTGKYLSYDEGSILTPANGSTPGAKNGDTWGYARSNYKDHFAEHYMKAILKPQTLAHDLIDAPQQRVQGQVASRDGKRAQLELLKTMNPPPSEAQLKRAQKDLDEAEAKVKDAEHDRDAQKQQFDIMRNDVFHTDKAASGAEARLLAKGVTPEKLAAFREEAARVSTPEQVARLEQNY